MTRPIMRARTAVAGVVVGALVLPGCSVYDAPLPGGPDTGDDPIELTARFRDVLDLVPNSVVKLNDVDVGKVTRVRLDGYVAEVTMDVRDDVELPANVNAQLRQTSLLGEKFVSPERPSQPSTAQLSDGDTIGLDRTGRNPEVEEVFSALALLLNGGGVGQLRSITQELNSTLDGRTDEIKSLLDRLDTFVSELDGNRDSIIRAIENTNRLAENARAQQGTIEAALDDVPPALRSLERQREDLVRLLEALTRLSDVGTRVIRESKDATIASLEDLGPVLEGLADAGQALPQALQVILTYPFVDEAVGRDPQVARNLHIGDYTNLELNLDLDLLDLPVQEIVCNEVEVATRAFTEALASNPITEILDGLPGLPGAPTSVEVREQIQASVIEELAAQVNAACDALPIAAAQEAIAEAIASLLAAERLPVDAIVGLVNDVLTGLSRDNPLLNGAGPLLGGGGSGDGSGGALAPLLPRGNGSGNGDGSDDGNGLLDGIFGRTAPAYGATQIDPFNIARHGLDPGVGTLLLQGVATQR